MPSISLACSPLFSLEKTVISGQCFRWSQSGDAFTAVVAGKFLTVTQSGAAITVDGAEPQDEPFLRAYFDLDTDYDAIDAMITAAEPRLCACRDYVRGLHILRQEAFEALISFIISQNNNIPRIRTIIGRLCERFGQPIESGFAFPTAEVLAQAPVEQFSELGCGYRASYIHDAAERVASGRLDLKVLSEMSTQDARAALLEIRGVGPKVAECVLLYGLGRMDAFPVDVWIKRALRDIFGADTPLLHCEYAGIAQQYIFEYIRNHYDGGEHN